MGLDLRTVVTLVALVAVPSRGQETRVEPEEGVAVDSHVLAIEAEQVEIGALRHLAAVVLTSEDERFGGFSGLTLVDGRELTAISDRGHWWTASLEHDASGRLRGVRNSKMGPLLDTDDRPVKGRARRDAEELLRLPDDSWLVSFEGDHRLWRYGATVKGPGPPTGRPEVVPVPAGLASAGHNSGLEAMAWLGGSRMLLLTEDMRTEDGTIQGWVGPSNGRAWQPLALTATGSFKPTGAAALPNGDVLLLERSFDIVTGVRIRVSVLARDPDDLPPYC